MSFDAAGGWNIEEEGYQSVGSGSIFAKSALKKYYSDNMPVADAALACVQALYDAADDDSATGGPDLTLTEVSEAANAIYEVVDPGANILVGAVVHPRPQPEVKLTLIATGLPGSESAAPREPRAPSAYSLMVRIQRWPSYSALRGPIWK